MDVFPSPIRALELELKSYLGNPTWGLAGVKIGDYELAKIMPKLITAIQNQR